MRRRIGQRLDELELLDDGARPAVRDDDGQRVLVLRTHVNEVDVEAVDLGDEVRQALSAPRPCASRIPSPSSARASARSRAHALRKVADRFLLGQPARAMRRRRSMRSASGASKRKGRIAVVSPPWTAPAVAVAVIMRASCGVGTGSFRQAQETRLATAAPYGRWYRDVGIGRISSRSARCEQTETGDHIDEGRQRVGLHLPHHLAAVRFPVTSLMPSSPPTCLFSRPDTTRTMTSRSREAGQRLVVLMKRFQLRGACSTARRLRCERVPDGIQQLLVSKRLGEELERSSLHRPNRHGDVALPGGMKMTGISEQSRATRC